MWNSSSYLSLHISILSGISSGSVTVPWLISLPYIFQSSVRHSSGSVTVPGSYLGTNCHHINNLVVLDTSHGLQFWPFSMLQEFQEIFLVHNGIVDDFLPRILACTLAKALIHNPSYLFERSENTI
ncbi:hypothetical protein ACMFMF_005609 [Clarireedia jacksonii]